MVMGTAWCNLCEPPLRVPLDELVAHLREVHDMEVEFEEWPDGGPVVIDESLTPEDFG